MGLRAENLAPPGFNPRTIVYKSNSDEIRTNPPPQVEFTKEASQFQNMFWENHDFTQQPVMTYIYLGYAYCFLFLKSWFCNGPETKLKGKTGIRENISLVFYHIQTVGA